MRENYIVIKELPDACIGTIVTWNESNNYYSYEKSCWVSPHRKTYLTAGQVTQTPEYFKKQDEPMLNTKENCKSFLKENGCNVNSYVIDYDIIMDLMIKYANKCKGESKTENK